MRLEVWHWGTILVTFHDLPEPHDAVKYAPRQIEGNKRQLTSAFHSFKLIHFVSAGVDHLIHHPCLKNTNITVTTSSGIHGPPIAEWAVMNWLVSSRNYVSTYEAQKQHRWGQVEEYLHQFHDQVGKKVGILGYGSIGRQSMFLATSCIQSFWLTSG